MWFEIINATCWIISFICFYLILHPNINRPKNVHISPFKKNLHKTERTFNVISILQNYPQDKLIQISKSFTNNFDIMIFNFNGSLNVGNIMRLGCLYGVRNYYIVGRKIYDSRSCVGSHKYVNIQIIKNIVTELPDKSCEPKIDKKELKNFFIKNNLVPIFVEQGGEDITTFKFSKLKLYNNTPVFIFGNETYGFDIDVINTCKEITGFTIISIPQLGILRSLNVSNSASIILWEYYKQTLINEDTRYKLDL